VKPFPHRQNWRDWITQYWNILFGRRMCAADAWILGPSAQPGQIGESIVDQFARDERFQVVRSSNSGLLSAEFFHGLEGGEVHPEVVSFYTHTAGYEMDVWTQWERFWGFFGRLVDVLFARRIDQLRLPADAFAASKGISSEIIKFQDPSQHCCHTLWLRKLRSDGSTIYAGFYYHVRDPRGQSRVKVVFPLPFGSATIVMSAKVRDDGKFRLSSAGEKFGDPGFYFVVHDRCGGTWIRYLKCFHEFIDVWPDTEGGIRADHTMLLWGRLCYSLHYKASNRANKSLQPTATAVMPPAVAGDHASRSRG
jgi:hypothetical protein